MRCKSYTDSLRWVLAFKSQYLTAITLIVACGVAKPKWGGCNAVSIAEPEAWVVIPASPDKAIEASPNARKGVFYRLFDRQINTIDTAQRSKYTSIEYEFTNRRGVQDRSTVTINFDPIYESIVMHELGIVRDGKFINKLTSAELQVLRTESDLDELFYNGTETLTVILNDVRVGDVLKYSYTRKGDNPVFDDLIEYSASTQFSIPMAVASFRLIASQNQPLYIRRRDLDSATVIDRTVSDDVQQISWSQNNLSSLKWIKSEPDWNRKSPSFTVSSVKDWQNVVEWSLPKYAVTSSDSDELNKVAKSITRRHRTKAAQVGAALRWVQDEIRYFGVELGENSHNPSTPDETLANRFGDCKDKTVLLITLLSKLNIEAHPALVNTDGALRSDKNTYRVNAFDHVIVHLKLKGQSHWIDPTRQNQHGSLGQFYEPNYGHALIIQKGQTALTNMSMQNSEFKVTTFKQFDLDSDNDGHALLTLRTNRKGLSAERYRGTINNNGLNSLQNDYVDYYRGHYNYVDSAGDIKYTEFPRNSSITVERYKLEELWTDYDDGTRGFDLESDETRRYLTSPKAPQYRTRPYALDYPNIIKEVNVVRFNKDIKSESAEETISNEYFTYNVKVDQNSETNTLTITHKFESHALSVATEDIKQYAKDVDSAWELSTIHVPDSGLDWSDDDEPAAQHVDEHAYYQAQ